MLPLLHLGMQPRQLLLCLQPQPTLLLLPRLGPLLADFGILQRGMRK